MVGKFTSITKNSQKNTDFGIHFPKTNLENTHFKAGENYMGTNKFNKYVKYLYTGPILSFLLLIIILI